MSFSNAFVPIQDNVQHPVWVCTALVIQNLKSSFGVVVGVGVCHAMTYPPPPPQNEIEFRDGGGCVCLWTSLQPFLGHFTFKRITNVCLHISCDDIIKKVSVHVWKFEGASTPCSVYRYRILCLHPCCYNQIDELVLYTMSEKWSSV